MAYSLEPALSNTSNMVNKISKFMLYSKGSECNKTKTGVICPCFLVP